MKNISFKIFKKTEGFIWSVNLTLFLAFFLSGGVACIYIVAFENHSALFLDILSGLGAISCIAALVFKLLQGFIYKTLQGTFEGKLVLDRQQITVGERVLPLTEIDRIEIDAHDYLGMDEVMPAKANFNPRLSNGVDNVIKIWRTDGEAIQVNFQQKNWLHIMSAKPILLVYCAQQKLSFQNLIELLQIEDQEEIDELHQWLFGADSVYR